MKTRKVLVWEDAQGKVWVSYNSPAYLQERHSLRPDLLQNIAVVETLAAAISSRLLMNTASVNEMSELGIDQSLEVDQEAAVFP